MKETDASDTHVSSLGWLRDGCFGCGPANPNGLQLKFEPSPEGNSYICKFEIGSSFVGPVTKKTSAPRLSAAWARA